MSSTVGSPTSTGWKRRSSAGSFSMCLRYSSSVVAPTARSSPRASIGLSMLPASTEPSEAPAPTIVWSSSMNTTTWPWASEISLSTAFIRSSNSPRYLDPATIAPMSSETSLRSRRPSGTSPATIRWASPSTIAVLPTPGSPISTGLFLVRRERTWTTRRISSSRPITGSSLPRAAASVRSRPKRSSAWNLSSGFWSVTLWLPRTSASAFSSCSRPAPTLRITRPASPGWAATASIRCSVEMYSSFSSRISVSAVRMIWVSSVEPPAGSGAALLSLGRASSAGRERLAYRRRVDAELREHGDDDAAVLLEQHREQVLGRRLRIAPLVGQPLGGLNRLLGLDRESVWLHWLPLNLSLRDLDYDTPDKGFSRES